MALFQPTIQNVSMNFGESGVVFIDAFSVVIQLQ